MLKAEGSFIVPENVPANEFLNLESNKISTSKNWAVWLHEYLLDFPGKQDVLRYVLTANAPETKDNDFTWKDFQARNNNELVAILGNFVNRVMVLTHKYYHGVVPVSSRYFTELDQIQTFATQIGTSIEHYKFREALQELMNLARLGNGFLQENEPWKKVGEQPEEVQNIMFTAIQITAALAHLAEPFLPFMSAKLKKMLLISDAPWDEVTVSEGHYLIAAGHQLGASELLFDKIEDEAIQKQLDKLEATKMQNVLDQKVVEPQKELITYEQFAAMDIRIGTIVEAEKVAKANKLLKLTVAVGIDTRTIVSGIAEHFTPEEIIGQQVQVLVNLAPRNLRGIDSHGMILMTESKDGKLKFVAPQGEDIPDGATVR
jgi:methionyl-tRNA synthetase